MKNKKYHTFGTVPKDNRKIDTSNTQIHDRSLSCFGIGTLIIENGGVKPVLNYVNPPPILMTCKSQ
jgi:hypothetical protein